MSRSHTLAAGRSLHLFAALLLSTALFLLAAQPLQAAPAAPATRSTATATRSVAPSTRLFANSGAAAAQAPFQHGLYLLHNFEYADAFKAFEAASRADPGFAMSYWGEALSFNHTLWAEQDVAAARAALARLAPTPEQRLARAPTARERAYLQSVELLFGAGDKADRDAAYAGSLAAIARDYPADLDARALYALSLLGLSNGQRNPANYMRAAAEAQSVLDQDPDHPGALHYLIHCFDDPVHAPLALRAARRYGKVAPDAEHALHMPSHIYFALGLWDDAIAANAASVHASHAGGDAGYHALAWLLYARLQKNDRATAAELLRDVSAEIHASGSREGRLRLSYLRAIWLAETHGDGSNDADQPIDSHGIASIGYFSAHDFLRGLSALDRGDPAAAQAALITLRARPDGAAAAVEAASAQWFDHVSADERTESAALADALGGAIDFHAGRHAEGIRKLQAAVDATSALQFEYGPPWSAKPLEELLGELLAADGRSAEARAAFQRSLAVYPNRRVTLAKLAALPAGTSSANGAAPPAGAAPGIGASLTEADLVGSWQLQRVEVHDASGVHPDPFYGPEVSGTLIYSPQGLVSVQIANLPRPENAPKAERASEELPGSVGAGRTRADTAARAAALDHYYAYVGRWSFDAGSATVTHHVDQALYASEEGADYPQQVDIQGDLMTFTRRRDTPSGPVIQLKIWRRLSR